MNTLGGFQLFGSAGPLDVKGKKLRALLAYLAAARPEARTRTRVASVLWGSYFDDQARRNLRAALTRLRQLLGSSIVLSKDDSLSLDLASIECDVTKFEKLAATSRLKDLQEALGLYRGEFLDGVDIREQGWNDWLSERRLELTAIALDGFLRIADAALSLGKPQDALQAARQALQLDDYREDAHRLVIAALKDLDRSAEALRVYETLAERLRDELGTMPSLETSRLADEVKAAVSVSEPVGNATRRPAIAVLPFNDHSEKGQQASFCEGFAEDVISELARFRDLVVTDAGSSFSFKGERTDLVTLREALGVDFVVHGSLRRYGARLRVSIQLSDTRSGSQIWSERYDREANEIFSIQDDLVRTISATLVGWLERRGRERARQQPTSSLAAYECVIEGRRHFLRMLHGENRNARRLFEQALALDPNYAAACAWLSESHLGDWAGGWTPSPRQSLTLGYEFASQAVELDDTDSRTHTALARASVWHHDFERARHHFDRALMLNPSDVWALASSARCLMMEGESERGLDLIKTAVRLNPLGRYGYQLGIGLFSSHRYAEASQKLKSVKEPIDLVYAWLAASLAYEGKSNEAGHAAKLFHQSFEQRTRECGVDTVETAKSFLADRFPYRLETDRVHFFNGLDQAGIVP